jgi:hypothetical protein
MATVHMKGNFEWCINHRIFPISNIMVDGTIVQTSDSINVLGIFFYKIHTILWSNVLVFNFECQA